MLTVELRRCAVDIPPAASEEPAPHKDAYIRNSCWIAGSSSIMDSTRQQQEWPLPQLSSSKDGSLRCFHQCASRSSFDQHPTKDVFWKDKSTCKDLANSRQQSYRTFMLDRSLPSAEKLLIRLGPTDFTDSECRVPIIHGAYRRRANISSGSGHNSSGFLSSHESELDCVSTFTGVCSEIPTRAYLGTVFQRRRLRHWDIYQRTYQEEETSGVEEEGT